MIQKEKSVRINLPWAMFFYNHVQLLITLRVSKKSRVEIQSTLVTVYLGTLSHDRIKKTVLRFECASRARTSNINSRAHPRGCLH